MSERTRLDYAARERAELAARVKAVNRAQSRQAKEEWERARSACYPFDAGLY